MVFCDEMCTVDLTLDVDKSVTNLGPAKPPKKTIGCREYQK